MQKLGRLVVVLCVLIAQKSSAQVQPSSQLPLATGWKIQTSAKLKAAGDIISTEKYVPSGWLAIRMPSTVVAAFVHNKAYPNPYFGKNLRELPGMTYKVGE